MSDYKGYRMVEVTRLANGNRQRKAITRWMSKADAFAFARNSGGGTVESKRGVCYSIYCCANHHMIEMGF